MPDKRSGSAQMKPRDRYLKIVEWSDEDECYVGTCPGLMLGGVHGDDEVTVYAELCEVVEEWIRIHEEDRQPLPPPTAGKDYSGSITLSVGSELHRELALAALRLGEPADRHAARQLPQRREATAVVAP